jgi:hypothetical protein
MQLSVFFLSMLRTRLLYEQTSTLYDPRLCDYLQIPVV